MSNAASIAKASAEAEAMHARVLAVSRSVAHLDMGAAQAMQVSGMMRDITILIRDGKSLIIATGDDGLPALYPSEAMMTAMDDLDVALRQRPGPQSRPPSAPLGVS